MPSQEEINQWTELATIIIEGNWQEADLACPVCNSRRVVFSFARNKPPKYGLFINCLDCKALHHFSLGQKPPNFRDDLVLPDYQRLEDEAIRRGNLY